MNGFAFTNLSTLLSSFDSVFLWWFWMRSIIHLQRLKPAHSWSFFSSHIHIPVLAFVYFKILSPRKSTSDDVLLRSHCSERTEAVFIESKFFRQFPERLGLEGSLGFSFWIWSSFSNLKAVFVDRIAPQFLSRFPFPSIATFPYRILFLTENTSQCTY